MEPITETQQLLILIPMHFRFAKGSQLPDPCHCKDLKSLNSHLMADRDGSTMQGSVMEV